MRRYCQSRRWTDQGQKDDYTSSPVQKGDSQMLILSVSAVTPTGGYQVTRHVNGCAAQVLVDTGTAMTLMQRDARERMTRYQRIQLNLGRNRDLWGGWIPTGGVWPC